MNSALLKSPSDSGGDASTGNGMFGKFKGFTLRPLNDTTSPTNMVSAPNIAYVQPTVQHDIMTVPQRVAPPPPALKSDSNNEMIKLNGTLTRRAPLPPIHMQPKPALPPPNPGSQARPLISMPVLENSTMSMPMQTMANMSSSTRELSPLRPAPIVPTHAQSSAVATSSAPPVPLHIDPKLNVKRDGTIRRIASFLKKEEKQPPPKEKTYIERDKLRQMEISAPIPVPSPPGESSNSDSETTTLKEEETINLVKRAQSMRSPTKKPNIQSFGSMRQSSTGGRPKSAVTAQAAVRPKSPPPRPPPVLKKTNSTTSSGYQLPVSGKNSNGAAVEHAYDDCELVELPLSSVAEDSARSLTHNDNIYSVIDEIPPAAQTLKRSDLISVASTAVGADMGLLSEIVSEIEKRNGDSLYSGRTLNSKLSVKQEPSLEAGSTTTKITTTTTTTTPTTTTNATVTAPSNGVNGVTSYLRPAALNTPVARVAPTRADISPTNAFSSFKPQTTMANTAGSTTTTITATTQPLNSSRLVAGGMARNKSINNKIIKTTTTNTPPSATIQKPKPLSAKPSFSSATRKAAGSAGSPTGKTNGMGTPRAAPTVKIASLTQRFEKGATNPPSSMGPARK